MSGSLEDLIAHIPEALFTIDRNWEILFANEAASRFLGRPTDELLGLKLRELFPQGEQADLLQFIRSVMKSGKTRTARYQNRQ